MPQELPLLTREAEACCAPLVAEELPEADAVTLARQFAALGDPVRLRLVSLMATAEGGEVCACDLVEPVGRAQGTVSHHLRILLDARVVRTDRRGRNIWYSVVPEVLENLRGVLATR